MYGKAPTDFHWEEFEQPLLRKRQSYCTQKSILLEVRDLRPGASAYCGSWVWLTEHCKSLSWTCLAAIEKEKKKEKKEKKRRAGKKKDPLLTSMPNSHFNNLSNPTDCTALLRRECNMHWCINCESMRVSSMCYPSSEWVKNHCLSYSQFHELNS